MHNENSVHGKLDKLLDSVYNEEHGSNVRLRKLEEAVIGNLEKPGLCEKVRTLQSDNIRNSAYISTAISALLLLGWTKFKTMFGGH